MSILEEKKTAQPEMITERDRELIELTATTAAAKVYADGAGSLDYYRITEKLLYNYKRLERLVRNEQEYLTIEEHSRSKSVVVYSPRGGERLEPTEQLEQAAAERLANYERTANRFRNVERVIDLFRARKEFIVIRMYYFGEDAEGGQRAANAPQYTWGDIAFELSERGILKDEKTARRWRKTLVNDIAVCMFGTAAAISAGAFRPRN